MPILWRYLLSQYIKVFFLSIFSFIAVLLVTRLDEIAQFASLGAANHFIWLFALYQIPYILPISVPISCLISAILLMQKLSRTHELTALRAAGLSMRSITAPILIAGATFGVANFYLISELSTTAHRYAKQLEIELRSINPLVLLQNKQLLRLRGAYVDIQGQSHPGTYAEDIFFAVHNKNDQRLNLFVAKNLVSRGEDLFAKNVSIISSIKTADSQTADHLMIENIADTQTPIADFSQIMKKNGWRLNDDHLNLRLLIVRIESYKEQLANAENTAMGVEDIASIQKHLRQSYTELVRRFSVAFAVFAFTLLGCSYGVGISRHRKNNGVFVVVALAAMYLSAFFIAKQVTSHFFLASTLLLLPHVIIMFAAIRNLIRIKRGIE